MLVALDSDQGLKLSVSTFQDLINQSINQFLIIGKVKTALARAKQEVQMSHLIDILVK